MKKKKGFTLIELLVVITVIAILASTVLVNLSGASERAKDSRITSALSQTRAVAEIIYSRDLEYNNLCSAPSTLGLTDQLPVLQTEIIENGPGGAGAIHCYASGNDYCVSAALNDGGFWCIDGSRSKRTATNTCTSAVSICN